MTCGIQTKAAKTETREGGDLKKSGASRGRSKLPRRPSSAGAKTEVADKAAQEKAARRRSSMRSNEVEDEERDVTQMTTGEANVSSQHTLRSADSENEEWLVQLLRGVCSPAQPACTAWPTVADAMHCIAYHVQVTNVRYWDSFAHTWNDEIMDSIKVRASGDSAISRDHFIAI